MTDQIQSLRDDIDYVKTLAVEGRNGPINGFIGFVSGMIWALAAFTYWLELSGLVRLPPLFHAQANWYALGAQIIFMAAIIPVVRRRGGVATQNNRIFGAIWGGLGLTILVMWASISLAQWRLHLPTQWPTVGPMIIALYGGAWFASAATTRHKWMLLVAGGSALAALALAGLPQTAADYMLAYAICIFLFGAAPGLYIMRRNARAA